MRMSHEILSPVVRDLEDRSVIASLEGTSWSVSDVVWHEGGVTMTLRKYPDGLTSLTTTLDLEAETATVRGHKVPASDLEGALDHALVLPHDQPLAAILRDTLDAIHSGPDTLGLEAEIRSLLRVLENGRRPTEDIETLFLPTGQLQDLSIDQGWGDRFLEIAATFDRFQAPPRPRPPHAASRSMPKPSRWTAAKVAPIALVIAAGVAGGLHAALGMVLILLVIAVLAATPFLWFFARPGASLFSSRGLTLREQIRHSPVAFLVLLLVVTCIEAGLLAAAFVLFRRAFS